MAIDKLHEIQGRIRAAAHAYGEARAQEYAITLPMKSEEWKAANRKTSEAYATLNSAIDELNFLVTDTRRNYL